MGRHEDLNRGVQPIGNDGAPFVNELQEQGPPPREKADLERLAKNITLSTSDAEKDRLKVQVVGAAQEEVIKSEIDASQNIVTDTLNREARAKYPTELNGKSNKEVKTFLEEVKKNKPAEFEALMRKVSKQAIGTHKAAGMNVEALSVVWSKALSSAATGIEKSAKGIANMSPQGALATGLIGGGTYLLTGKKRWALGLGGLTAVFQSREATNSLNKQALPAAGRLGVGAVEFIGKLGTAPGHVINAIINGKPEQVIDIANAFTQGDVNNVLRYIAGGEVPPDGNPKILIEAVREYMAKDIAVAPAELQPILKVILTGSPAQKSALSRDQITPAVDFLIQTSHLNISQQELVEILQKRVKSKKLTIEERQKFSLAQSRNIVDKYLQGNPNFSYEDIMTERLARLRKENGGKIPQLNLGQAIPPSDKLKKHDFNMSMPQINKFIQSKGLPMPKYGTEWLLWAYVLTSMITPLVGGIAKKVYGGVKKKPEKKTKEPEIKKKKAEQIAKAIKSGKTKTFIGALVGAGIIQSAHRGEIEKEMGAEFNSADFGDLSENLDTDYKTSSIQDRFYKNFDAKYGSKAIVKSRNFANNKGEVAKIKNWWSNNKKNEGAKSSVSLQGEKLPADLKSVTVADFKRVRKLTSVANPGSYFRKLNGIRKGVTYLPIVDANDKPRLLKIQEKNGSFLVAQSRKTWNPLRKVAKIRETFSAPFAVDSISFDSGKA